MTKTKAKSRSPLPVRIVQLHNKLLIAAAIGLAIGLLLPQSFKTPACVLIGWDAALVIYLVLTFAMMWRAQVAHILADSGAALLVTPGAATIAISSIASNWSSAL